MTRRICLLFALALLCPAIVSAQSRQAEPAMTGVWTGELNRDGADSATTVTLTLKSDTAGKVTGTVAGLPNPAEVKDGSYDAKTGTLKLSLGKLNEPAVLVGARRQAREGHRDRHCSGEATGTFRITRQK